MQTSASPQDKDNAYRVITAEEAKLLEEIRPELLKFKDPVFLGSVMYKAGKESEKSRHMFERIMERLDRLEQRIEKIESGAVAVPKQERLLGDIDEEIVAFIRRKGFACADEVQSHFRYRGKNGASARLNRLCELNLLEKQQAGRKVYFRVK
jgi:hypothetical protein